MERAFERLLLGLRWLLLPLYVALLFSLLAIYVQVGRELLHLVEDIMTISDTQMVMVLCSVLDLVLLANLLVMVAVSSYESYVSRIEPSGTDKPEWLGKLDSGNVKVKVAVSVAMISAIHLLRAFLGETSSERMMMLALVHVVFVLSTLAVAYVDRISRHDGTGDH